MKTPLLIRTLSGDLDLFIWVSYDFVWYKVHSVIFLFCTNTYTSVGNDCSLGMIVVWNFFLKNPRSKRIKKVDSARYLASTCTIIESHPYRLMSSVRIGDLSVHGDMDTNKENADPIDDLTSNI